MTINRRAFLGRSALGFLGVVAGGCAWREITALLDGVALPFVTPTQDHYVKNGAEGSIKGWAEPRLDVANWQMTVDGLVSQPLEVTFADLVAEPRIEFLKTMRCVVDSSGAQGLNGTAIWGGVPLRVFLERAGIDRSRAKRVHLFGADGFRGNLPLSRIYSPTEGGVEPLIVTHMNGQPLSKRHGGPARLVIADAYGYACVKWIERITATTDESAFGTYQDAGFTDNSVLPVGSRITKPLDNITVPTGPATVHGFAVSGLAPITRVEARVDGGPWVEARILSADELVAQSPQAANAIQLQDPARFGWPLMGVWALWAFSFEATTGKHRIEVRAFDATGRETPAQDTDITDGVNAIATVRVKVAS